MEILMENKMKIKYFLMKKAKLKKNNEKEWK